MDLRQVGHFLTLSRELNFTRAAEACGISQPAFSQSIRKLEDELGGALVDRNGRRTRLSALGEALLESFERVREAESALKALARAAASDDRLRLAVRVEAPCLHPFAVAAIGRLLPLGVAARLSNAQPSERAATEAHAHAVLRLTDMAAPEAGAWWSRPLARGPLRLIAPLGHRLAGAAQASLADIALDELIWWPGCPLSRETLLAALLERRSEQGGRSGFAVEADDFWSARRLAAAGCGVAIASAPLAEGPDLASVPFSDGGDLPPGTAAIALPRPLNGSKLKLLADVAAALDALSQEGAV
ncbi:MAG: LysR family transcriptional regulator [Pseudomonadota bacterium]